MIFLQKKDKILLETLILIHYILPISLDLVDELFGKGFSKKRFSN
jgi:hypothetical protein